MRSPAGSADDLRELRNVQDRLSARLANLTPPGEDDHDEFVGVTSGAATVGAFVAVIVQTIDGVEIVGTSPTLAADADVPGPVPALCLGPNAPASGTPVLVSTSPEGVLVFNS